MPHYDISDDPDDQQRRYDEFVGENSCTTILNISFAGILDWLNFTPLNYLDVTGFRTDDSPTSVFYVWLCGRWRVDEMPEKWFPLKAFLFRFLGLGSDKTYFDASCYRDEHLETYRDAVHNIVALFASSEVANLPWMARRMANPVAQKPDNDSTIAFAREVPALDTTVNARASVCVEGYPAKCPDCEQCFTRYGVPRRHGLRKRWGDTWSFIRVKAENNELSSRICGWLQDNHADDFFAEDTIRKIVRAGKAGCLDPP